MKAVKWVVKGKKKDVFWPSKKLKQKAWVSSESVYKKGKNPITFWSNLAKEGLDWNKKWKRAYVEKLPYFKWFVGGKLNACHNALDRHVKSWRRNKVAIIWEPEPVGEKNRVLTYFDLYREVNKFSNVLKDLGVKKGDVVGIYLPMIPEVQIAMLACARIGAIHSVVFSAFSSEALRYRMEEVKSKVLITVDGYYRRGKLIDLKSKADEAVKGTKIKHVIVVKRANLKVNWTKGRDHWWDVLMKDAEQYCEPKIMDSEDTLFILYTSGTTGKPKGILHDTGGYLTQAYWTTKWNFDLHDEDIFWCSSDIGWITGHTYACYGPLLIGATMLIYEGVPDFPQPDRWCEIIREAWLWYFDEVGQGRCPIIDTWWQTETGGTLINSLPGIGPFIPTVAGRSFPGTRHEILDEDGNPLPSNKKGNLVQLSPFAPGMLRGIYKNHKKYVETYWKKYGKKIYFTSDGAWKDKKGNFRLTGRLDDVMKVAGHRLATAELEDAITRHPAVAECAIVAMPHEIKGEVPVAFVTLKGIKPSEKIEKELIKQVEKYIGPIARPEKIIFAEDLPKTRSGKIIRRILKRLIIKEPVGDVSTLANPEIVKKIKNKIQ